MNIPAFILICLAVVVAPVKIVSYLVIVSLLSAAWLVAWRSQLRRLRSLWAAIAATDQRTSFVAETRMGKTVTDRAQIVTGRAILVIDPKGVFHDDMSVGSRIDR